jgi:ankyrin repeat protein
LCQKKNPELAQWVITNADKYKKTTKRRPGSTEKANKLVRAAGAAEVDVIRWLISQRVNVDTEDSNGRCALRTAASVGNAKMVQTLLTEFDANANAQSRVSGNTALHFACKNNKEDVVKVLVESGADLTIKNKAGALAQEALKNKNQRLSEWIGKRPQEGGECDDAEKESSAEKDEQLVHVATS